MNSLRTRLCAQICARHEAKEVNQQAMGLLSMRGARPHLCTFPGPAEPLVIDMEQATQS